MKTKNLIVLWSLLLLNSCIVKSLHPFYTKETLSFDASFIGKWKDNKNGTWTVFSFKEAFLKDAKKKKSELSKEELKMYTKYQKGYIVKYETENTETSFIVMPFKINKQLFLDFIPIENHNERINSLQAHHIVYTHSLVKYDVLPNGKISIKWLDENKMNTLFREKRIKLKHEVIGLNDNVFLLTATSEELQKFIKKYMNSNDEKKWETSTKFTLTRVNEK